MTTGGIDKAATVAGIAEQRSAGTFSEAQVKLQEQQQRLQQLLDFRREYQQRFAQLGREGACAVTLAEFHRFIAELNQAIEQQQLEVAGAESQLVDSRSDWLQQSQRRQALDSLVDQRRRDELLQREKRAQQRADESTLNRSMQHSPE